LHAGVAGCLSMLFQLECYKVFTASWQLQHCQVCGQDALASTW
jgi:hypothetical protein